MYCKIIFPFLLLFIAGRLFSQVDERTFYLEFFETLTTPTFLRYCHPVRELPTFCRDEEKLGEDRRAYCEQFRSKVITDTAEYARLPKYLLVMDTLAALDVSDQLGYLLARAPEDSLFLRRVPALPARSWSDFRHTTAAEVRIASHRTFTAAHPELLFGKNGHFLNLGYLVLSRVYVEEATGKGIFHFNYLGGPLCGYRYYVLFVMEEDGWRVRRSILTGEY